MVDHMSPGGSAVVVVSICQTLACCEAVTDIVFQFDDHGEQTDLAWVLCRSAKDCSRVLHKVQVSEQRALFAFHCSIFRNFQSRNVFSTRVSLDAHSCGHTAQVRL